MSPPMLSTEFRINRPNCGSIAILSIWISCRRDTKPASVGGDINPLAPQESFSPIPYPPITKRPKPKTRAVPPVGADLENFDFCQVPHNRLAMTFRAQAHASRGAIAPELCERDIPPRKHEGAGKAGAQPAPIASRGK